MGVKTSSATASAKTAMRRTKRGTDTAPPPTELELDLVPILAGSSLSHEFGAFEKMMEDGYPALIGAWEKQQRVDGLNETRHGVPPEARNRSDTGAFEPFLKVELVDRHHYRTRAEARTAIFGWIAWYNRFRLHSTNDYLSPIQWEQQHAIMSPLPSTTAA